MTNLEKFYKYSEDNKEAKPVDFFKGLQELFEVSYYTVTSLWFASHRSWFKPEMLDEIIRLDSTDEWKPNFYSGEFRWENGRFKPMNNTRGFYRCDACNIIYGARKDLTLKEQRNSLCPGCRLPLANYFYEYEDFDEMKDSARIKAIKEGIWIR